VEPGEGLPDAAHGADQRPFQQPPRDPGAPHGGWAQALQTHSGRMELITPDIGRPVLSGGHGPRYVAMKAIRPPKGAEGRFELFAKWTRTQRIRTAGAIPIEGVIVDQAETPVYLKLADKAKHLRELGLSDKTIARALGISDKTVAKAIERARNT
jgi:hypothetical protein